MYQPLVQQLMQAISEGEATDRSPTRVGFQGSSVSRRADIIYSEAVYYEVFICRVLRVLSFDVKAVNRISFKISRFMAMVSYQPPRTVIPDFLAHTVMHVSEHFWLSGQFVLIYGYCCLNWNACELL